MEDVRLVKSTTYSYSLLLWCPYFACLATKPHYVHVWFGYYEEIISIFTRSWDVKNAYFLKNKLSCIFTLVANEDIPTIQDVQSSYCQIIIAKYGANNKLKIQTGIRSFLKSSS